MIDFFKNKNNSNKLFIYLLVSKNTDSNTIVTKILISKSLLLHGYTYLCNNFDTLSKTDNIIDSFILKYIFDTKFTEYTYVLFYMNRVLLHSFLHTCNLKKELINLCSKTNFLSNLNYLKRLKDWYPNWKKSKFSLEKSSQNYTNFDEIYTNVDENYSLFSIYTLSKNYFNIDKSTLIDNEFICSPISEEKKTTFERISERPNTDYILKCNSFFENDKHYKFM